MGKGMIPVYSQNGAQSVYSVVMTINMIELKECDTCHLMVRVTRFNTNPKLNTTTCVECRSKGIADRQRLRSMIEQIEPGLFRNAQTKEQKQYISYIRATLKRGYTFTLSFEEYMSIKAKNCNYCNKVGPVGIDRVDNTVGYELSNCVPCCGECNMLKGSMPVDRFLALCCRIADYHRTK